MVAWLRRSGTRVGMWEMAVGVAIGLATWPVAATAPSIGIDPSWIVGLHLAARDGLSFGHDILFTFGPLGFLAFPQPYLAWTSGLALAFVAVVHIATCVWLFHFARQALGRVAAIVLVAATAFTFPWIAGWIEYGVLIFLASASAVLRRQDRPTGARFAATVGIAVGLAGLGKLNIAFVSLVIAAIGILATARDPRRSALVFGAAVIATFVTLWVASGQDLGGLPGYARGALEVYLGHGQSMGQLDPQLSWAAGVTGAATLLLVGLVWLRSSDLTSRDRLALWLLFAVMIFAGFKGGFIRQGFGLVIYVVGLLALWPVVIPRNLPRVMVAMPVIGMLGIVLALGSLPITTLVDPPGRLQAFAQEARTVLFERSQAAISNAAALRGQYGLPPEATALLEGRSVDIQPWEAAVAYAYPEIRWRPQPVFQAYQAYTPFLDRLNADLLAGENAPDRILWLTPPETPLSIDGRNVWFDSPMAKIEMVCRYSALASGPTWQVLGRVANRCGPPITVGSATSEAGALVEVPRGLPTGILTIRVSGMGRDLVSQLVTLAYRAPPWWMTVGDGVYRIPLGINGEPTILAATADLGYEGALMPARLPETVTIGPGPGVPGHGSPLSVAFEIIPVNSEP
jgi:hypothetical protein